MHWCRTMQTKSTLHEKTNSYHSMFLVLYSNQSPIQMMGKKLHPTVVVNLIQVGLTFLSPLGEVSYGFIIMFI